MATLEDYEALVAAGFEKVALEQQEVADAVSELQAQVQQLIDRPPAEPDYGAAMLKLQGLVDAIPTIYNTPTPDPIPTETEGVDVGEVPPVEPPVDPDLLPE